MKIVGLATLTLTILTFQCITVIHVICVLKPQPVCLTYPCWCKKPLAHTVSFFFFIFDLC